MPDNFCFDDKGEFSFISCSDLIFKNPIQYLAKSLELSLAFGRNVCESKQTTMPMRRKSAEFIVWNSSSYLLFKTEEKENPDDFENA